jgi:Delta6-protoilludene synthase
MNEKGLDLQPALDWIGELHDGLVNQFLADYPKVPSFGNPTLDEDVATYVDGLGNWVRANDMWSFEVGLFLLSETRLR